MAKRISRIIRRARTTARDRGLPVERLLPALEVLIGVAAGLIVGGIAAGVYRSYWATHRMSTALSITVTDKARQQRAASAVAKFINKDAEFVMESDEGASALGLRGKGLRAIAEPSGAKDENRAIHVVDLVCEGHPGDIAEKALSAARERIINLKPIKLKPENFDTLMVQYGKGIVEDEGKLRELNAKHASRKPSARESEERRKVQDKLDAADKEYRQALAEKRELVPIEKRLKGELAALQKEKVGLADVSLVDADALVALEDEQRDLEDRLREVDTADCTPEHPIMKRIKEIIRRRRASSLPSLIDRKEREIRKAATPEAKLKEASAKKAQCQQALEGVNRKYRTAQTERDAIRGELNAVKVRLNDNRAKKAALKSQPLLPIAIVAEAEIVPYVASYWWIFYPAGILLGVMLTLVLHRVVVPAFSVIDDELDLADRLRVPVLGKVPRLAMLSRH